nr:DUF4177 domain-containing protein [Clostridium sp.]
MEKWEYRTVKVEVKGMMGGIVEVDHFDNELNKLGEFGWKLVSCFATAQAYGASREIISVFKRRK